MGKLTNLLAAMLIGTMATGAYPQECSSQNERPKNKANEIFFCGKRRKGYTPEPKTEEEKAAHKLHQKKIKARRNKRRRKARR